MADKGKDGLAERREARLAAKRARAGMAKAAPAKKAKAKKPFKQEKPAEAITPATPPKTKPTPEEVKANRLAALEAGRAVRAEKKAAKDAAQVKKAEAAQKVLNPLAREINERWERANKQAKTAEDHRLAAALLMKDAEDIAKKAGIKFKDWAAEHIKEMSWENARKLLYVGKAPNPQLAIADLRLANAERNKAHRAKAKRRVAAVISAPPVEQARVAVERMADTERAEFVRQQAESLGLRVGPQAVEPELPEGGWVEPASGPAPVFEQAQPASLVTLKTDFNSLRMAERMEFVKWAAAELGLEFAEVDFAAAAE